MELETLTVPLKMNTSGFNPVVAGVVAGITAAVGAMVGAVAITAKWANELDQLGDVMGGTKEQIAAMAYVARVSGVGVETLAKANVILEKGLLKANGRLDTIGIALQKYGIKVKYANGQVKDQATLTDEIGKKYQSFATQQERINFLTEIYGKNGAALVDFFDTLAQQGGIDAVTKKVEALGLAIDSGRYEQFNRNLEELKMMGTSIAVAFTEMVMPQLERFLGWLTKVAPKVKAFVDRLLKAFEEGDYEKIGSMVSEKLSQLDSTIANKLNGINWTEAGKSFGEMLDRSLSTEISVGKLPKSVQALGKGIEDFLVGAIGQSNLDAFKNHFVDYLLLQMTIAGNYMKSGWAQIIWDTRIALNDIATSIATKATEFAISIRNGWTQIGWDTKVALNNLKTDVEQKLRDIAKTFFDRALGWTQQMKAGLSNGIGGLLAYLSEMVGKINSILNKIITTFTINIKMPWDKSAPTVPSGGNTPGGSTSKKRASGGSVIAGQVYSVNELGKPEYFIPNTNGRINPEPSNKPVIARIDKRDMELFADIVVQKVLRTA